MGRGRASATWCPAELSCPANPALSAGGACEGCVRRRRCMPVNKLPSCVALLSSTLLCYCARVLLSPHGSRLTPWCLSLFYRRRQHRHLGQEGDLVKRQLLSAVHTPLSPSVLWCCLQRCSPRTRVNQGLRTLRAAKPSTARVGAGQVERCARKAQGEERRRRSQRRAGRAHGGTQLEPCALANTQQK